MSEMKLKFGSFEVEYPSGVPMLDRQMEMEAERREMKGIVTRPGEKVTVRIGNGEKLHPAIADIQIKDAGKPWQKKSYVGVMMACSCPGSQSGFAANACSIVSEGWELSNCRHRGLVKNP